MLKRAVQIFCVSLVSASFITAHSPVADEAPPFPALGRPTIVPDNHPDVYP